MFLFSVAIIGLFSFGTINGYDITDLSGKKLTKNVSQQSNNQLDSKPASNASQHGNDELNSKHAPNTSQQGSDELNSKPVSKTKYPSKKSNVLSVEALCSCCLYEDYEAYNAQWVNYCPQCHRRGTLVFEETYDCPEGMIRCTNCDADFCAVHGREHVYRYPTYLTPA